jgi:hypothetical protein
MGRKLIRILTEPERFYTEIGKEGFCQPLGFLLFVSAVVSVFTPLVNFLGWPSTDISAAFQAQILAWRITETELLPRIGILAYPVEAVLIFGFALLLASMLSVVVHLLYRFAGGKGTLRQAWKAVCYGAAPCILLGGIPYWSLFLGVWALILQFYYGPKILYSLPEGRAVWILTFFVGATLLEFALSGTTVGFGPR